MSCKMTTYYITITDFDGYTETIEVKAYNKAEAKNKAINIIGGGKVIKIETR